MPLIFTHVHPVHLGIHIYTTYLSTTLARHAPQQMPLIVSGCTWVSIHITCISTKTIRHSSGCPSIVPPSLNRFYWLLLNNNILYLGLLPDSVPIFTPNPIGHSGLDILAAAALTGKTPGCTLGAVAPQAPRPDQMLLSMPGPYNPATAISAKVARRILELEFVEMVEISADDDLPQENGRPASSSRPPRTNISQWLERHSVMAAILATRFPEKALELLVYQAAIIRAERNYEGKQWVAYDRQYRREALARKDLNWMYTFTMRLSLGGPKPYQDAHTVYKMTIPHPCVPEIQSGNSHGICPCGQPSQHLGLFLEPLRWTYVGTSMKEGARDCNVGTNIFVWDVRNPMQLLTVLAGDSHK